MGTYCSLKDKTSTQNAPLLGDADSSSVTVRTSSGVVGEVLGDLPTTEDNNTECKFHVRKHLSSSNFSLKNFLMGGISHAASRGSSVVENNEDDDEESDENLEQLWESCYDLSELVKHAVDRVSRYRTDFVKLNSNAHAENEDKGAEIMSNILIGLKKLSYDDVVYELQSVSFSTKREGAVHNAIEGCLQKNIVAGLVFTNVLSEAYDFFLLSCRTGDKLLIERSCRVWNNIFRINTNIQDITRKFESFSKCSETEGSSNADEHNMWEILNSLLNVAKRKQIKGRAENLLKTIEELRKELSDACQLGNIPTSMLKLSELHL